MSSVHIAAVSVIFEFLPVLSQFFLPALSQVEHSALVRSDLTDETVEVSGFALGLVSGCVRMECGFVLGSPSR